MCSLASHWSPAGGSLALPLRPGHNCSAQVHPFPGSDGLLCSPRLPVGRTWVLQTQGVISKTGLWHRLQRAVCK